jgi:hypothetical protein
LEALKTTIAEAATGGSMVTNMQKAASDNGVITPSMRTMTRELVAPVITQSEKTVTVTTVVPANEGGSAHGSFFKRNSTALRGGGSASWGTVTTFLIIGALSVAMATTVVAVALLRKCKKDTPPAPDQKPITQSVLESALTTSTI